MAKKLQTNNLFQKYRQLGLFLGKNQNNFQGQFILGGESGRNGDWLGDFRLKTDRKSCRLCLRGYCTLHCFLLQYMGLSPPKPEMAFGFE